MVPYTSVFKKKKNKWPSYNGFNSTSIQFLSLGLIGLKKENISRARTSEWNLRRGHGSSILYFFNC